MKEKHVRKPGCEPGMIYYEVIVDAAGRPRALLTELEFRFDPSARGSQAFITFANEMVERIRKM